MMVALAMAFAFGAAHALSPGHGKTIVAAYLVGSRGTFKHALFLGAMVTFTHTVSVFLLGFGTLFLSKYVVPDKIYPILGAISGIMIVWIGGTLFYKRLRKLMVEPHGVHEHPHQHGHTHDHQHQLKSERELVHAHVHATGEAKQLRHTHSHDGEHAHVHDHGHSHTPGQAHSHDHDDAHAGHSHDHGHDHSHEHAAAHKHDHAHEHTHSHDHSDGHDHGHHHGPGGHSHVPEGEVTFGSLIGLAVSGGMVPCPSALILLLSSVALGKVGLGLMLLTSFSLGLALVLIAIGCAVLYAKNLIPNSKSVARSPFLRMMPVISAGVITIVGVLMTLAALGLVKLGIQI